MFDFGNLFGGAPLQIDQMGAINEALAQNQEMGQQEPGGWRQILGELGSAFKQMGARQGGGGGSTNSGWRPMDMQMFGQRNGPAIDALRARYDNFLSGGRY